MHDCIAACEIEVNTNPPLFFTWRPVAVHRFTRAALAVPDVIVYRTNRRRRNHVGARSHRTGVITHHRQEFKIITSDVNENVLDTRLNSNICGSRHGRPRISSAVSCFPKRWTRACCQQLSQVFRDAPFPTIFEGGTSLAGFLSKKPFGFKRKPM